MRVAGDPSVSSHPYLQVLILALGGVGFVAAALITSWLLRPRRPDDEKQSTYECGEEPVGSAWFQFPAQFYLIALLFVVFEVEAVYLIPWALKLGDFIHYFGAEGLGSAWFAVIEMGVFLAILLLGWVYALRKGALEWITE
jgi:NADH-quinone oxidoreductase subunit A